MSEEYVRFWNHITTTQTVHTTFCLSLYIFLRHDLFIFLTSTRSLTRIASVFYVLKLQSVLSWHCLSPKFSPLQPFIHLFHSNLISHSFPLPFSFLSLPFIYIHYTFHLFPTFSQLLHTLHPLHATFTSSTLHHFHLLQALHTTLHHSPLPSPPPSLFAHTFVSPEQITAKT